MRWLYLLLVFCILRVLLGISQAEDWPTYRHDNRRSGVTQEKPDLPLNLAWVRKSSVAPMMAWSGPAKWDAYSGNKDLQSMRNFDPAFFVTSVKGAVFFGSSIDNAVHCLDSKTGKERWVSFAGGAVRLPPAIDSGRVYFGSDDGYAYCVGSNDGKPIWKFRPAQSDRLIPSNGKLISPWPVRSGVMLSGKKAYFAASLLPWEKSYLCALDKDNGKPIYISENANMTLQGALLGSTTTVYAPQGRSMPLLFNATNGKAIKGVGGMGGTFCLLTEDELLVGMPANQKSSGNVIQIGDPSGGQAMLKFAGADRLLVVGEMAYIHQGRFLQSLNRIEYARLQKRTSDLGAQLKALKANDNKLRKERKAMVAQKKQPGVKGVDEKIVQVGGAIKDIEGQINSSRQSLGKCFGWETSCPAPYELIFAGGVLFVGAKGKVMAFDAESGKEKWSGDVDGHAYGLVYSDGRLYVSTSLGHIYCFSG
ncbi:MAG: PQQ-binding-like beta-propeller repeat protein [Verrucomicrobiaceae bacterium]|nr:PQQ-binding-like beta-propeller repeat protein [Verrucomicrobiaceae bacterium]